MLIFTFMYASADQLLLCYHGYFFVYNLHITITDQADSEGTNDGWWDIQKCQCHFKAASTVFRSFLSTGIPTFLSYYNTNEETQVGLFLHVLGEAGKFM